MRACPVCGGPEAVPAFPFETIWTERTFHYKRCSSCLCTFVDPVPDDDCLKKMYSAPNYHEQHYTPGDDARHGLSLSLLNRWKTGRRLLDFGCGDGTFIGAAKQLGLEAVGAEYHETTVRLAQKSSGCDVFPVEEILAGRHGAFDVIRLGDVLEHLPGPIGTLRELSHILEADGVLIVEGPLEDNASLVFFSARAFKSVRRMVGVDRPSLAPPTHLIRLSARVQRQLMREAGFEEIYSRVHETGFPYLAPNERIRGMRGVIRRSIGWAGLLAARLESLLRSRPRLGNRFEGVFRFKKGSP